MEIIIASIILSIIMFLIVFFYKVNNLENSIKNIIKNNEERIIEYFKNNKEEEAIDFIKIILPQKVDRKLIKLILNTYFKGVLK